MTITVPVSAPREAYLGDDLEIPFACFEQDGTTPFDCSGGGRVEFAVSRRGLHPFSVLLSTDDSSVTTSWTPATGAGTFMFRTSGVSLVPGIARYKLISFTSSGRVSIQAVGWIKFLS